MRRVAALRWAQAAARHRSSHRVRHARLHSNMVKVNSNSYVHANGPVAPEEDVSASCQAALAKSREQFSNGDFAQAVQTLEEGLARNLQLLVAAGGDGQRQRDTGSLGDSTANKTLSRTVHAARREMRLMQVGMIVGAPGVQIDGLRRAMDVCDRALRWDPNDREFLRTRAEIAVALVPDLAASGAAARMGETSLDSAVEHDGVDEAKDVVSIASAELDEAVRTFDTLVLSPACSSEEVAELRSKQGFALLDGGKAVFECDGHQDRWSARLQQAIESFTNGITSARQLWSDRRQALRVAAATRKLVGEGLSEALRIRLSDLYYGRALAQQRLALQDKDLVAVYFSEALSDLAFVCEEFDPTFAPAHFARAEIYQQQEMYAAAVESYDRFYSTFPTYFQAASEGRSIGSIKIDPNRIFCELLLNRGVCQFALHQVEVASADFDALQSTGAFFVDAALRWRGKCHAHIGDHASAVRDYTAALELNPRMISALVERAEAYKALGEKELAAGDEATAREILQEQHQPEQKSNA